MSCIQSRRSNEAQNIPRRRRHRRGAGAHRLRRRRRRHRRRLVRNACALTIAKPDGAITTESNNPYLGDSSASKYGYGKVIFESLALVNPTGDLGTTPWLAETVEWNDDYTQLTVVARNDVKWSDGEHFTADDIAFSFNQVLDGKLNDTNALDLKSVSVDGDTVTIDFDSSKYTQQARVLHFQIVPEHIWKNIDDPNTDPVTGDDQVVGTGPYALDSWSTESVTLAANPTTGAATWPCPSCTTSRTATTPPSRPRSRRRGRLGAGVHPADPGQLPRGRRAQPLPRLRPPRARGRCS